MVISQSFIKDAMPKETCGRYIQFRYIDRTEIEDDEETKTVMFRGTYFEWHLLGAVRNGEEPKFAPNKIGKKQPDGSMDYRPKAELDLFELVKHAKEILLSIGLNPKEGKKQVYIKSGDLDGTLDWVTKDFMQPDRQAAYDIKYTETAYDDRWNGWANFEDKWEAKVQATQYIMLYWLKYEVFVPFYFIVFGKSKWCRIIKVELTKEGLEWHERTIETVKGKVAEWEANKWKPSPDFVKCMKCPYNDICKDKAGKPEVEVYRV